MNTDQNLWIQAEEEFQNWLEEPALYPDNPYTGLRKSIHIYFRKQLRRRISEIFQIVDASLDFDLNKEKEEDFPEQLPGSRKLNVYYNRSFPKTFPGPPAIKPSLLPEHFDSISALYNTSFKSVSSMIISNNGTIEDAKDIFQDALVIMMDKIKWGKIDLTSCTQSTYLYSISRNLWYERLRKMKKETDFTDTCTNGYPEISTAYYDEEPFDFDEVNNILTNLGNPCKKLIELFYFERLSWEEIAISMGYATAASVRNQKYKCIERIKKQVLKRH